MKVLIWLLCCFTYALITTLINSGGVALGAIPTVILFGTTMWLAKKLCRKWDDHIKEKESLDTPKEGDRAKVQQQTGTPRPDQWLCTCGKIHYRYESSCVCGKSRIDILLAKELVKTVSEEENVPMEQNESTLDTISFCRKCGQKLLDGAMFCNQCGTQIIKERET